MKVLPDDGGDTATEVLLAHQPRTPQEAHDVTRLLAALREGDGWSRAAPLHVTGSAVVLDPAGGRVLLRWHDRMQRWLQVGGHGDPGEVHPLVVACREATEETGLGDLVPWPDGQRPHPLHVVVVPVPAGKGEPDHEHGDVRYVLATAQPEQARPEDEAAVLRWVGLDDALGFVEEENLRETLRRVLEVCSRR